MAQAKKKETPTADAALEKAAETQPETAEVVDIKKAQPMRALPVPRFNINSAGRKFVEYYAIAEAGTPPERVLDPDYWKHVANQVDPRGQGLSRIVVTDDAGNWYRVLVVRAVLPAALQVAEIVAASFAGPTASADWQGRYKVKYNGPHDQYSVYRLKDGEKVATGFATEAIAETYAKSLPV